MFLFTRWLIAWVQQYHSVTTIGAIIRQFENLGNGRGNTTGGSADEICKTWQNSGSDHG